jgi:hypothetical protein
MVESNINNVDKTISFDAPMVNENIFSSINEVGKNLAGTAMDSIAWLRSNAKTLILQKNSLVENTKDKLPDELDKTFISNRINTRSIGRMFMYAYDPKFKKKLPYYDTLPLLILIDFTDNGFRGLNLHYVPPFVRKRIIEALTKNLNTTKLTEKTKTRISYNILKRAALFAVLKPCFKRYLFSHVRSSFMYIDPKDWQKAIMLPTEQFQKQTKSQIYSSYIKNNLKGK